MYIQYKRALVIGHHCVHVTQCTVNDLSESHAEVVGFNARCIQLKALCNLIDQRKNKHTAASRFIVTRNAE